MGNTVVCFFHVNIKIIFQTKTEKTATQLALNQEHQGSSHRSFLFHSDDRWWELCFFFQKESIHTHYFTFVLCVFTDTTETKTSTRIISHFQFNVDDLIGNLFKACIFVLTKQHSIAIYRNLGHQASSIPSH